MVRMKIRRGAVLRTTRSIGVAFAAVLSAAVVALGAVTATAHPAYLPQAASTHIVPVLGSLAFQSVWSHPVGFVPQRARELLDAARSAVDNALGVMGSPPEVRVPAHQSGG